MGLDLEAVRGQFPALGRSLDGRPVLYADGPGGTQCPRRVIDAMAEHLRAGSANLDGSFITSVETTRLVDDGRAAVADLLGASAEEVAFGQNMTSLTFCCSRALGREWRVGDEIVVTSLDHDANVTPWVSVAEERGVIVRTAHFDRERFTLDPAAVAQVIGPRTRLVAITHASNALGTVVDVASVARLAHEVGALVYVDAVHYAPHGPLDVREIDCDLLACSAYKFFGPHIGVLYGKRELLERVRPYRLRPAPAQPPGSWETGTQSFESIAGVRAAVDYLAALGGGEHGASRRQRLAGAWQAIGAAERALAERFVSGAASIGGLRLYGVGLDAARTPTFAIALEGHHADQVAEGLATRGIFAWSGHYYAVSVMERLGLLESGGLVRIGFVHYNTPAEVDRVLEALDALA